LLETQSTLFGILEKFRKILLRILVRIYQKKKKLQFLLKSVVERKKERRKRDKDDLL